MGKPQRVPKRVDNYNFQMAELFIKEHKIGDNLTPAELGAWLIDKKVVDDPGVSHSDPKRTESPRWVKYVKDVQTNLKQINGHAYSDDFTDLGYSAYKIKWRPAEGRYEVVSMFEDARWFTREFAYRLEAYSARKSNDHAKMVKSEAFQLMSPKEQKRVLDSQQGMVWLVEDAKKIAERIAYFDEASERDFNGE